MESQTSLVALQARVRELEEALEAAARRDSPPPRLRDGEHFRQLVDTVGVIMWEADPTTWQFTFVSEQAERITGYAVEEWLSRDFRTRAMHPNDREEAVNLCITSTMRCEPHDFQYRMIAADGRVIWFRDIVTVESTDGRPTLLRGVMIDITAVKQAEEAMCHRLEVESLVASISKTFVCDAAVDVDDAINTSLERLGEFADVDRSYVFLISRDGKTISNTHEWCAPGIEPQVAAVQNLDLAQMSWWIARLRRHETIHLPSLDEIPVEATVERAMMESQDVQSLVCVPLSAGGDLIGFLGLDAVRAPKSWSAEDIRWLESIGQTIGGALARQQSEHAVRDSERRYRLLFENNPNPMWVYDIRSLRFLAVNEAAVEQYGYSVDEFLAMTIRDVRPADDAERLETHLAERDKQDRSRAGMWRHVRKDGTKIDVEIFSHGLSFDGRAARMVVAHDVTERERATRALRANEHRLRLLTSQVPAVMWTTDESLRFTSSRGTGLRALNLQPDEVVGQTIMTYVESSDPAHPVIEAHHRALSGQAADFSIEWQNTFYRCIVEPLRNEAGKIIGTIGIAADSTERHRAELALADSEHRWRTVFENALDPLWDWDVVADRTRFSPSWVRMLGFKPDEFDPDIHTWEQLVHPDDKPSALAMLNATLRGERANYVAEYRVRDCRGHWRWVYSHGSVVARDDDGQPLRMIGSVRDMTERRQLEDALRLRIAAESMLSEISSHFINLSPEEIDRGIVGALRTVGTFTSVDRAHLFLFANDQCTMSNTHEWCAPDIESQQAKLQNLDTSRFPWWMRQLRGMNAIDIERVSDLNDADAAMEKRLLREQSIQSCLVVPLAVRGELIGFLGFDTVHQEKRWLPEDAALLGAVGEVLTNALERQRTDHELREKERFLSTLFSNLPGWVYRCRNDEQWTFEFASEGIESCTGYRREVFFACDPVSYGDIIHPDDRSRVWQDVQHALERREAFQLLYRIRRANGEERWLWEQGRGVFDTDGSIIAIEGFINDVTEHRHREFALRESENRFIAFMQNNPAAAWLKDQGGRYIFINSTLETIWERRPSDVVGRVDHELMPEDVARQFRENDEEVLRTGKSLETYETMVHPDGTVHTWLVLKFPLLDARGTRMVGGIGFDRTDHLRAETELRQREHEFKVLVENTPDIVTRIDREFTHVYLNPAAAAAFGAPPGPQRGLALDELLLAEPVRQLLRETLVNVTQSGRELVAEFEVGPRHRSEHYEARLVPEFSRDDTVESVLMIGRKITERKIAEAEIRKASDLHRLLLRELDHRVRNNLASLMALIDISSRRATTPAELAASIRGRVQAMSTVHDLLSKGRQNAIELVDLLGSLVPEDMLEQVDISGPTVYVPANQGTALGMVVQELVANSLKYGALRSAEGRIRARWSLQLSEDQNEQRIDIEWLETGGPSVTQDIQQGLGSCLITGLVRSELRGEAHLAYEPTGASHRFTLRLERVDAFDQAR